jgi:hypothetical protein
VTVEQFTDSRGERAREVRRIRFKLVSKIDALELLGKHHKLYIDRVEHEYGGVGLADRLAAALARVDGETRSDIGAKAARLEGTQAPRPPRPTDRRRRSPRAVGTVRRRQNIARKVQNVALLK